MDENSLDNLIDNILPNTTQNTEDISDMKYTKGEKPKFSIRRYWFEILLFMICVMYLYYISSSIFSYTIFGLSIGRFLMQILVFVLPFLGLWFFYRVNKSKKVDSVPKIGSIGASNNLMIAMRQHGRCASCMSVLDKTYQVETIRTDNHEGKRFRAVCQPCFDRSCLNNSLYKTLRDF